MKSFTELFRVFIPLWIFVCIKSTEARTKSFKPSKPITVDWTKLKSGLNNLDRLPDFSWAGYHNSENPLPVGEKYTQILSTSGDNRDRTQEIQTLLNAGGVIRLGPGNFTLNSASLNFTTSNTILQGSVDNKGNLQTTLLVSGSPRYAVTIGTNSSFSPLSVNFRTNITHNYVAVGSNSFNVNNVGGFSVGDEVIVQRVASAAWIYALGMDNLVRAGVHQVWIPVGAPIIQARVITAIQGQKITIDIPIVDSLNLSRGDQSELIQYNRPSGPKEIGLENLKFFQPGFAGAGPVNLPSLIPFWITGWSEDVWFKNVYSQAFKSFYRVDQYSRRVTFDTCTNFRSTTTDTSKGTPADWNLDGQLIKLVNCRNTCLPGDGAFGVTTSSLGYAGSEASGPIVILNHTSTGANGIISTHQRWATAVLVDSSNVNSVSFTNRGTEGSGQGWSVSQGVVWNTKASNGIQVQSPPQSANWLIGGTQGSNLQGNPYVLSGGKNVSPPSLFQAQLQARLAKSNQAKPKQRKQKVLSS